jgi:hypothetical protein
MKLALELASLDLKCRMILMSAYLYYSRNESVLSDAENDALCVEVADRWAEVPERYKPLLDPLNEGPDAIRATTSHCKYTAAVEGGALRWLRDMTGAKLYPLMDDYGNGTRASELQGFMFGTDLEVEIAMRNL